MGKKVMVVDDDDDILKLVAKILELNGMEPVPVRSGIECLKMLHDGLKPDAILLDVMMPEKDGFEICREIKENENYRGIAVIMLTAKSQNRDRVDSYKCGADAYLTKPFDNKALIDNIRLYLDMKDRAGY